MAEISLTSSVMGWFASFGGGAIIVAWISTRPGVQNARVARAELAIKQGQLDLARDQRDDARYEAVVRQLAEMTVHAQDWERDYHEVFSAFTLWKARCERHGLRCQAPMNGQQVPNDPRAVQ